MNRRLKNVVQTPWVILGLFKQGFRLLAPLPGTRRGQWGLFGLLMAVLIVLVVMLCDAMGTQRAFKRYTAGDFNASAALFERELTFEGRYNAAAAYYRAGEYERALAIFSALASRDVRLEAVLWFNRANTLVRLKEFAKAREAYAHSLVLHYDEAALQNMLHILDAESQDHMLTGRQEGKKRAQDQEAQNTRENRTPKAGGGSNQPSDAQRNRGAGGEGRNIERDPRLDFTNKGKSRLSSKQYELINQRSVNESAPW